MILELSYIMSETGSGMSAEPNSDDSTSPSPGSDRAQGLSASEHAVIEIKRRLGDGTLGTHGKLPSEPQLAKELGVSRVSARTALAQLETQGIVSRRKGSGTYINSLRPLVHSFHRNLSADQLIGLVGYTPGIYEMSWKTTTATPIVSEHLKIELGSPIVEIYRVRTSNARPVTIEYNYFSADLLPENDVRMGSSLYSFFAEECGIDITFGIAELIPNLLGEANSKVLGANPSDLCLTVKQVDYDKHENPISFSIEHHLADAFDFRLVRDGPNSE